MNLTKFAKFINRLEQESVKREWSVIAATQRMYLLEVGDKQLRLFPSCYMSKVEVSSGSESFIFNMFDPDLYDHIDKLLEE